MTHPMPCTLRPRTRLALAFVLAACALAGLAGMPARALAQGFEAVFTRDGIDVWAVGDGGLYWRSFDGGATWTARPPLGTRTLRGVAARGLVAIAVGDSGHVWRSIDSGGSWTLSTLAGAPDLTGIEFPADNAAFVVGAGGTIALSTDGGQTWTPQSSGTAQRLNAVRFRDALTGWAVGRGGVALKTVNGGALWSAANTPAPSELLSVDFVGANVWAVGTFGAAYKSATSGTSWTPVNLQMDSQGDVRRVWMDSATQVTLTGGGGFLRTSPDGGVTWNFATHPLLAPTTAYFEYGGTQGWLASNATTAVARTADGGASWTLPTSTATTYAWTQKLISPFVVVRGNTFATTPQNRNSVWCVLGNYIYKSVDRGESWTPIDTINVSNIFKVNSFYVSPKDSTHWIAAIGPPDGIAVTNNSGGTWNVTLDRDFGEYGTPLEMNPDKPDTLIFGPEDGYLYRTKDFGATWDTLSNPGFRSPCDIVITPGNESRILVADGVTGQGLGQVFQSADGGQTFTLRFTGTSSENPALWVSRLQNSVAFVTNWSSGGVWKSADFGVSWSEASEVSSAWGGGFALDDPRVTIFSRYAGTPNYVSVDQGQTFTPQNLTNAGSGYAVVGLDRATWLDLHSAGVYKLVSTWIPTLVSGKTIAVTAPNGGESWAVGSVHAITWSAPNFGLVHVEYRTSPLDAWVAIADVPAYLGTYAWTVPNVPSATAQVRVRDDWASGLSDLSDAAFTIAGPTIAVAPLGIAYGTHPTGSATLDSVRVTNAGTSALHVTAIGSGDPAFTPGRTSITLAPGASDTVGVTFRPVSAQPYAATLTLANDAGPDVTAPLSGTGSSATQVVVVAPNATSAWQYGHTYNVLWQSLGVSNVAVEYRTSEGGAWLPVAASLPASAGTYAWLAPGVPTSQARVRVRDISGSPAGMSSLFSIVVPAFAATPSPLDFGNIPPNYDTWDTLHVANAGTAPVTIANVVSDNPRFAPGRTAFAVAAGGADTLSVHFAPLVAGADSALFTFTTDDPVGTHTVRVRGTGAANVAVGAGPTRFALEPGYPNPFGSTVTLRFSLPVHADVRLDVYTTDGRRVQSLLHAPRDAGEYAVVFAPARALPSGVYFVHLAAGGLERTVKILRLAH